jgi:HSP20 family protein
MDLKKIAPWNWFKNEEKGGSKIPVSYTPNKSKVSKPNTTFHQMEKEMESIYDTMLDFFRLSPSQPRRETFDSLFQGVHKPLLDIATDGKGYTIKIELPGVELNDIQLEISERTLTVYGEKRMEENEAQQSYYRVERSYGSFRRVLTLPEDADEDSLDAIFKNGVLTITVGRKTVAETTMKQIEIQ